MFSLTAGGEAPTRETRTRPPRRPIIKDPAIRKIALKTQAACIRAGGTFTVFPGYRFSDRGRDETVRGEGAAGVRDPSTASKAARRQVDVRMVGRRKRAARRVNGGPKRRADIPDLP